MRLETRLDRRRLERQAKQEANEWQLMSINSPERRKFYSVSLLDQW